MEIRIPEKNKQAGVCYAMTDDGIELPVIDITHPAFAFSLDEPELFKVIDETLADLMRFKEMAPEARQQLVQQSILLRGGLQAAGSFLSGMATYLHKLGPANLGEGYASDWDRRAAGQLLPAAFRLRLQSTAQLLADVVAPMLGERRGPLHLLSIGGGTALDSLNALILLQREHSALLAGRSVAVSVFDIDTSGPSFGGRALAALREAGAPLSGLDATFSHIVYDWAEPEVLSRTVQRLARDGAPVLAGSSEGGLFEYGSDEQIVTNLRALYRSAPADFVMVGALLKDKETLHPRLRWIGEPTGIRVRLLGLAACRALAQEASWQVARVVDGPLHHVVALTRA